MLAKPFRFHGHQSVRRIYRRGRSVRGSLGSLHVYSDANRLQTKAAVVVSRKVSKSAVVRNRIRRRIYEQVRLTLPELAHPAELVFTVYLAEAATMPPAQLAQEVSKLLKHAKLL